LTALQILTSLLLAYCILLGICRLLFSSLSHVPGPKLAAITSWYEFYYNVVLGGKFFLKIETLHEEYGPIIRIGPNEVHISDPSFHSTIYSSTSKRNKTPSIYTNACWQRTSAFSTLEHDYHRLRRSMLNPFFSTSKIRSFAPWIQDRVSTLCERFNTEFKTTSSSPSPEMPKILNLTNAFSCLTADTVMEYSFASHYDLSATSPDFESDLITVLVDISRQITAQLTRTSHSHQDVSHTTIFAELLSSPQATSASKSKNENEKSHLRLFDEAQIIVTAGLETTATALAVAMFYILEDRDVYGRLRKEMDEVWGELGDGEEPTLVRLEGCVYLTGVICEALRLSYGPISRLPRTSPSQTQIYTNPTTRVSYPLPPGTIMSTSTYTLHQNTLIFPNPKAFLPSRWLPDSVTGDVARAPLLSSSSTASSSPFPTSEAPNSKSQTGMNGSPNGEKLTTYLASFGKGSRSCLGMNLAWAELYITLANVVRKCEMELWETGRECVVPEREYFLGRMKGEGIRVRVL
ncbi:cytochrome P450, partial [Rhexocercosporidium sp. MPI-PUGE-AT-0058]